jgi:hypothetical protein
MPYTPPRETLVAASRSNFEVLAAHMVLAHPHTVFHPCTYGLYGGVAAIAAALIDYDDVEVAAGMTTKRRQS